MSQVIGHSDGRFTLDMDRETFNNEVIPWLRATFGQKRGKKRDWTYEEQEYLTEHEKERIKAQGSKKNWSKWNLMHQAYWCRVFVKHNRDCITFLAKWGDYVKTDSNVVYCYKKLDRKIENVKGDWSKIGPMVRWMQRNVKPHLWSLQGNFGTKSFGGMITREPEWQFYLASDDAHMAFLMVRPT